MDADLIGKVDTSTIAGVALAAYLLVGTLKHAWPNWASGKEQLLSLIGSIVIGAVMKKWGAAFQTMNWGNLATQCMIAGILSQLFHDKLMDPILGQIRRPGDPPAAPPA